MKESIWNKAFFGAGFSVFCVLLIWFWRFGYIHLDGGYYVSAGYGVAKGQLPYRDFFFPQGPIYPYVYGLFHYFVGSTVQTTRLLSMIFALVIFVLLSRETLKSAGAFAATIAAILLSLNSFFAYFLVVEKLNSLSALLLLAASIMFLRQHNGWKLNLSLTLFSLAVTTRYTLLPVLGPVYIWLIWQNRRTPLKLVLPVLLQIFVVACITAPFLLQCPEQFLYGIIGVHVSADAGSTYHFGLMNKLGAISQLARYATLLIFITIPVVLGLFFAGTRKIALASSRELVLWIGLGLISLAHFSANWFHASYQVPVVPLWIMLAAMAFARLVRSTGLKFVNKAVIVALIVGGFLTVLGQGSAFIWFDGKKPASPFLENVAREVRKHTKPGGFILTDQPLIAHQAGRPLLHGFEGAPFTYTPFWDTERCLRFSTVNDHMLEEILREQLAELIVLGSEGFKMASPGFVMVDQQRFDNTWHLINRYYQPVSHIDNFAGTTEKITFYRPRKNAAQPDWTDPDLTGQKSTLKQTNSASTAPLR